MEVRGPSRRVAPRHWDHSFSGAPCVLLDICPDAPCVPGRLRDGLSGDDCLDVTAPHPVDMRVRQLRFVLRDARAPREDARMPDARTVRVLHIIGGVYLPFIGHKGQDRIGAAFGAPDRVVGPDSSHQSPGVVIPTHHIRSYLPVMNQGPAATGGSLRRHRHGPDPGGSHPRPRGGPSAAAVHPVRPRTPVRRRVPGKSASPDRRARARLLRTQELAHVDPPGPARRTTFTAAR